MKLQYTTLKFKSIRLDGREGSKLRGFFAEKYKDQEILHNHRNDQVIYQYPKVQYKVINGVPIICGIEAGAEIITDIGFEIEQIYIGGEKKDAFQKELLMKEVDFGVTSDYCEYNFVTPWLALNQRNSELYNKANNIEREEILERILIGNIISVAKAFNYNVDKKLKTWLDVKVCQVNFKNLRMLGFKGRFKVNFAIPNYLGLGKSVSRGFGTVHRK